MTTTRIVPGYFSDLTKKIGLWNRSPGGKTNTFGQRGGGECICFSPVMFRIFSPSSEKPAPSPGIWNLAMDLISSNGFEIRKCIWNPEMHLKSGIGFEILIWIEIWFLVLTLLSLDWLSWDRTSSWIWMTMDLWSVRSTGVRKKSPNLLKTRPKTQMWAFYLDQNKLKYIDHSCTNAGRRCQVVRGDGSQAQTASQDHVDGQGWPSSWRFHCQINSPLEQRWHYHWWWQLGASRHNPEVSGTGEKRTPLCRLRGVRRRRGSPIWTFTDARRSLRRVATY